MITPQVKENKVIFGPCRLSYTHVFNRYNPDGDQADGKYMTNVLIPKDEKETIEAINKAIAEPRNRLSSASGEAKSLRSWICHYVTATKRTMKTTRAICS